MVKSINKRIFKYSEHDYLRLENQEKILVICIDKGEVYVAMVIERDGDNMRIYYRPMCDLTEYYEINGVYCTYIDERNADILCAFHEQSEIAIIREWCILLKLNDDIGRAVDFVQSNIVCMMCRHVFKNISKLEPYMPSAFCAEMMKRNELTMDVFYAELVAKSNRRNAIIMTILTIIVAFVIKFTPSIY